MPVPHRCSMPTTGWPTCVTRSGSARPSPPPAPPTAPSSRSARTQCSPRQFPTPLMTRVPATHITTASARCSATLTTPSHSTRTSTQHTPSGRHSASTRRSRTPPSRPLPGATPGIGSTSHLRCPPTGLVCAVGDGRWPSKTAQSRRIGCTNRPGPSSRYRQSIPRSSARGWFSEMPTWVLSSVAA